MYMKAVVSLIPCPTCNIPFSALFFRAGYMLNLKWCLSSSFQLYKAALLPFQLCLELSCLRTRALSVQFPSSASHPRPPVTLQRSSRLDIASPGLCSGDIWVHLWLAPCPSLGEHRIFSALQHWGLVNEKSQAKMVLQVGSWKGIYICCSGLKAGSF